MTKKTTSWYASDVQLIRADLNSAQSQRVLNLALAKHSQDLDWEGLASCANFLFGELEFA